MKKRTFCEADLDEEKLVREILHGNEPLDLAAARLRYFDILAPFGKWKNTARVFRVRFQRPSSLQAAGASVSLDSGQDPSYDPKKPGYQSKMLSC